MYRLAIGRAAGRGRRALRLRAWIDPTAVDTSVERVRSLGINVSLADEAAEGGLDMARRTAEPVVKVEMAEGGIEVVAPEQADHPPAQPQAFRVGGRAAQQLLCFGKFVDLLLGVLDVARRRLLGRLLVRTLGKCGPGNEQHRRAKAGGEETQTGTGHGCSGFTGLAGRLVPSHADPFGQHCGERRSGSTMIKAAA